MAVPVELATAAYQGYPPSRHDVVRANLLAAGVPVEPYRLDLAAFERYLRQASYPEAYRRNFGDLFVEKALEHHVSLELVGRAERPELAIDIASCDSPFPEISKSWTGIETYRQDLGYPAGVHDMTVGGSADDLPFADASFTQMTLHCSFEHFEGEADSRFIREAARTLRRGGRLCILPLYLSDVFHNLTDPGVDRGALFFDDGAAIAEVTGWNNRFGRVYDVERLRARVLRPAEGAFTPTLFFVENETDVAPVCYLKFVLLLTRR